MRFLAAFVLSTIIIVLAIVGYAYSGWYDVSATSPHGPVLDWLFSTTYHASVERRAQDIEVPELGSEERLLAGISDYDVMCAGCHGAPGRQRDEIGRGLNPQPPDLEHAATHMSAAELFWITRHGIKMTGMPAWGLTHEDDDLWSVVAFVTELPGIDAERYQDLLARASDQQAGHHGDATTGRPAPTERSGEPPEHSHDDHPH